MFDPIDIGIIEIDDSGFINRWYQGDRKKMISDFLPSGPGWVPEHYLSFISNFCDGAWVPPKYFLHTDKNIKNNQPENIIISNVISDNCLFDSINEITDFGIPKQPKNKFETAFVFGGFYQNKIYAVPRINRCEMCGIPIFGEPYQTDYMDNFLCTDCYRDYSEEACDINNIKLLTNKTLDPMYNIFIDFNRGLDRNHLIKKYQNEKLIDCVIENKIMLLDDLLKYTSDELGNICN